ncbi:MAG: hypothetical protein R3F19_05865 [Verrucomicrobiales bacterium]
MAGIQNRTAAELKAELTAAIEQSRALLGEAYRGVQEGFSLEEPPDRLTGREISFEDAVKGANPVIAEQIDFSNFSDEELDLVLRETEPEVEAQVSIVEEFKRQVSANPMLWTVAAVAVGTLGAKALVGDAGGNSKNPRQNASQSIETPITHGSLMGLIMRNGFEMIQPALQEAVQGWLRRFVEKNS